MLGILGGTSFLGSSPLEQAERVNLSTEYGEVTLLKQDNMAFIPRHGLDTYLPPHKINHQAHLLAFQTLGVSRIISFGSTGGLNKKMAPGTFVLTDDIFSPFRVVSFMQDELKMVVPEQDSAWRKRVADSLLEQNIPFHNGGTYVETLGPRFESPAEIRWLASVGDVVGMTCAAEFTLACELKLPLVILAMVDNWANGISDQSLSPDEFRAQSARNQELVLKAFSALSSISTTD